MAIYMFANRKIKSKQATVIALGLQLDLTIRPLVVSRTLSLSPPRLMEHETAPKVCLKPATVVVSF